MFTSAMPHLFTPDLDRATAFYRGMLGFEQTFQFPPEGQPQHVELRLGDSMLALSSHEAARAAGLNPTEGHPLELVVWCDDIDAATTMLRKEGAPVIEEPHRHVAHRRALVGDPDGNWVALVGD